MSKGFTPEEFENIARIKEKVARGEVGGSEDPASGAPVDPQTPELTQTEIGQMRNPDPKAGISEEEAHATVRVENAPPSEFSPEFGVQSLSSARAAGMGLDRIRTMKDASEAKAVETAIMQWKLFSQGTSFETKREMADKLLAVGDHVEITRIILEEMEKDPANKVLRELYEFIDPYSTA